MPCFKKVAACINKALSRHQPYQVAKGAAFIAYAITRAPVDVIRDSFKGHNVNGVTAALTAVPPTAVQKPRCSIRRTVVTQKAQPILATKKREHFCPSTSPKNRRAHEATLNSRRPNGQPRFLPSALHKASIALSLDRRPEISVQEKKRHRDEFSDRLLSERQETIDFNETIRQTRSRREKDSGLTSTTESVRVDPEEEEEKSRKSRLENAKRLGESVARNGVAALPLHQQWYQRFEAALDQDQDPRHQLGFEFMTADEKKQLIFKWIDKQQDIFRAQQQAHFERQQALERAEAQRQMTLRQESIQRLSNVGEVIKDLLDQMSTAFGASNGHEFFRLAGEAVKELWLPAHNIFNGLASPIIQAETGLLGWPLEMMEQTLLTLNSMSELPPDVINFREGLGACLEPIAAALRGPLPPAVAAPAFVAPSNTYQPPFAAPNPSPPVPTTAPPATTAPSNPPPTISPPTQPPLSTAPEQQPIPPSSTAPPPKPLNPPNPSSPSSSKTNLIRKLDSHVDRLNTLISTVNETAKSKSGLYPQLCNQIYLLLQVPISGMDQSPAIVFSGEEAGGFGRGVVELVVAMGRVGKGRRDARFFELRKEVERVICFLNP